MFIFALLNHYITEANLHGFMSVDEIPHSNYEICGVWEVGARCSVAHYCRYMCDLRNTSFPYGFDLKLEIHEL